MDLKALKKARSRLRIIGKAVADMAAEGGWSTSEDFTDLWFGFLTAFKSTYTALEQGSKTSPQSMQWFGAKSRQRRSDELLQYLYQARNDEEHGLDQGTRAVPGRMTLQVTVPESLQIDLFSVQVESGVARLADGQLAKVIERQSPHIVLVPVRDRDKAKVHPVPTRHFGQPIEDQSPLNIAQLALAYLTEMVNEVEGLS